MSLLSFLLGSYSGPSRLLDQHFGIPMDENDPLCPTRNPGSSSNFSGSSGLVPTIFDQTSSAGRCSYTCLPMSTSKKETEFQAHLDVQQFRPEEITITATGNNTITIEGKHEEKKDQHGFISRHFVRRYVIPEYCNYDKVESKLSSDGVLSITAPLIDDFSDHHMNIPVVKTGQPAKME